MKNIEEINLSRVLLELSNVEELVELIAFINIEIQEGPTKVIGKNLYIQRETLITNNIKDIGSVILRELFQILFNHSSRGFKLINEPIDKEIALLASHAISNSCVLEFSTSGFIYRQEFFQLPNDKKTPTIKDILNLLNREELASQFNFERLFHLIKSNLSKPIIELLNSMGDVDYFLPNDLEFIEDEEAIDSINLAFITNSLKNRVAGKTPGSLHCILSNNIPTPKEPWYKHLINFVVPKLGDDKITTWNKPNRRNSSYNFVLPGKQPSPSIKNLVVIIDSSGSMSDISIREALGHIKKIQLDCKCSLHIVVCDCVVQGVYPIKAEDSIDNFLSSGKLAINGRGGTSFIPAQVVACMELKANVIVLFTDGYGPFLSPSEYYKLNGPPLLIVFTKDHTQENLPSYCHSINMNLLDM
jgi:hypothetical protein